MTASASSDMPLIREVLRGGGAMSLVIGLLSAGLGSHGYATLFVLGGASAVVVQRWITSENRRIAAWMTIGWATGGTFPALLWLEGVSGSAPLLLCVTMLVGLATLGQRAALAVTGAGAAMMGLAAVSEQVGWLDPVEPGIWKVLATSMITIAIAGIVVVRAMDAVRRALREAEEAERRARVSLERQEREVERRASVEARLQDALVQARQANRAKSRFLASMSHELRTPLNAIIGYAEILEEEALPDSSDAADLRRIHGAGKHLLGLINDVLDISKIEAGRMALQPGNVDLDEMLREVAETVIPSLEGRGNRLHLDTPPLGEVFMDGMRLRQVLLNLLSNAAKFTENGEVELAVRRIGEGVDDEQIEFRVRDTGIGISPEQQARLFQPFSQADNSIARKYGGTGLGLALCRRFAEMMEGEVELQSALGAGTTVIFRVPTRTEASIVELLKRTRLAELEEARKDKPVVLCVDDEGSALTLLDRMLLEEGVHPIPCKDPTQAIELALAVRPNVITLDLHMPNLDGGEVLRLLKENPELQGIPVVVVSVDGAASNTMQIGAAAWMRKPIDKSRLLAMIETVGRDAEAPVLVVDDDGPTRNVLVRMLDAGGIRTVEASDGRQALEILESITPRMVLLDLMMPEMDGFQVAETLRHDERWSDLPIVVLTSATLDEEDRERLAQCTTVLHKDERTLRNLVDEVKRVA